MDFFLKNKWKLTTGSIRTNSSKLFLFHGESVEVKIYFNARFVILMLSLRWALLLKVLSTEGLESFTVNPFKL